jgi:hypothetical protein
MFYNQIILHYSAISLDTMYCNHNIFLHISKSFDKHLSVCNIRKATMLINVRHKKVHSIIFLCVPFLSVHCHNLTTPYIKNDSKTKGTCWPSYMIENNIALKTC